MLIPTGLVALAAAAGVDRADFQIMTSPAYGAFARMAEASCPARRLRYLHPADLDGIEEDFLPSLTARDQRHIAAFDQRSKGRAPAGASCPAQHTLAAIERAGRLDGFVRFACASRI